MLSSDAGTTDRLVYMLSSDAGTTDRLYKTVLLPLLRCAAQSPSRCGLQHETKLLVSSAGRGQVPNLQKLGEEAKRSDEQPRPDHFKHSRKRRKRTWVR